MNQRLITRITRLELRNGNRLDWNEYRRFWQEYDRQGKTYLVEVEKLSGEAMEEKIRELKKIGRYRWQAFVAIGDVEKFPLPGDPGYVEGYIDAYPEI